jgi:hypothetical protein
MSPLKQGTSAAEMNKPRVLLEHWMDQYHRMQRSRDRLRNVSNVFPDYDDAFFHAVQDAWHLKDWIKNDQALDQNRRDLVIGQVHTCDSIMIIADLANCTKHLELNAVAGAEFQSRNAEAKLSTDASQWESKRWFTIRLTSGAACEGTELLDEAIAAWNDLLKRHQLL